MKEKLKEKMKQNMQSKQEEMLIRLSHLKEEEILKEFKVTKKGLDAIEVSERTETYGKNMIDYQNEKSTWGKIKEAVINPFNVVLLLLAGVTFITDIAITQKKSYETFFLMLVIVGISSIISYTQQEKSNKAAKKLHNMITNQIDVIRNGKQESIDIEEAVPGDIVKLSSGDMLPGDVRFLETKDLFIDQSALTGESNPVEKFMKNKGEENLTSISNIGFMGTNVVSGSAKALLLTTGKQTYFGNMAKSLAAEQGQSNFEKGINKVSILLIKFMVVMVPIIFITNLITKNDWLESLLFGITIAVGLIPEMLPVITTSTLAKGAVEMAKKKTIVKRLSAMQAFGEMDILCTDKTGTLTEDRIILERYMNAQGTEDKRILKHVFLNSYFQTGLKNLMDVAIISRGENENLGILKESYEREDEIPFDFTRRRMSVVLKDQKGKRQLITKGAVLEILSICSFIEIEGKAYPLTEEQREKAIQIYEENNKQGLRMIAVAQKNEIHGIETFGTADEKDMVLIGFVSFLDPPKQSSKSAIKALKKYGVKTVVLTGDSEGVAMHVCKKLGIPIKHALTGEKIEEMTDEELQEKAENCHLFSKLSPFQKKRVVSLLQQKGHTVGYMGDGINDALPLKQADVGISVDTAVDIAKETADILLLEKDLNVLEEGVVGGRKTIANISKYLNMATSGNLGNMLSVMIASIFLPFLPLLPLHILIQNILSDFAQLGMPFDNVEEEYITKPQKWDSKNLMQVMFKFGIASTILDILCFLVLWFVFGYNTIEKQVLFQTGWFVFGVISQSLIIHTLRTKKMPFISGRPSKQLVISTVSVTIITILIGFTNVANILDMAKLNGTYLIWLVGLMVLYTIIIQLLKQMGQKRAKASE